jgi:hypothetical protein
MADDELVVVVVVLEEVTSVPYFETGFASGFCMVGSGARGSGLTGMITLSGTLLAFPALIASPIVFVTPVMPVTVVPVNSPPGWAKVAVAAREKEEIKRVFESKVFIILNSD